MRLGSLGCIMFLIVACAELVNLEGEGFVHARVESAVDTTKTDLYEGSGEFSYGSPPGHERIFSVNSIGVGESEGDRFMFSRYRGGKPGRGTYDFAVHRESWREANASLGGQYWRAIEEGTSEKYVVERGTLTITESKRAQIGGHFSFTAVRYCDGSQPCDLSRLPDPIPTDLPRIKVEGDFVAVEWTNDYTPDVP